MIEHYRKLWQNGDSQYRQTRHGRISQFVRVTVCVPLAVFHVLGVYGMAVAQDNNVVFKTRAPVWSVITSPDGRQLYAGCSNGEVIAWTPSADKQSTILNYPEGVKDLSISPDGNFLVAVVRDKGVFTW